MSWCISSPGSLCLGERINTGKSEHQNDWVRLKVQEAAGSFGAGYDYQHPASIWEFFLSYLCSASLSSLSGRPMMSATDLIVSWNNVPDSHSLLKEKTGVSLESACLHQGGGLPGTSVIKISSRADRAQVRASRDHQQGFFFFFCQSSHDLASL